MHLNATDHDCIFGYVAQLMQKKKKKKKKKKKSLIS